MTGRQGIEAKCNELKEENAMIRLKQLVIKFGSVAPWISWLKLALYVLVLIGVGVWTMERVHR